MLNSLLPTNSPCSSCDLLWANPRSPLIRETLNRLSPWWRCVLLTWYDWNPAIDTSALTSMEAYCLHVTAPVWLNMFEQWQYRPTPDVQASHQLLPPRSHRNYTWRYAIMSYCGIRSLADVFTAIDEWPTADDFYSRIVSTLLLRPIEPPSFVSVRNLYKQLTQIHERVPRPPTYTVSAADPPLWPWVLQTATTTMRFPAITPSALRRTLLPSKPTRSRHPVARHGVQPTRIATVVASLTSDLQPWISPVYLDVRFRVWWRILPVNYLCWNGSDPAARCCALGCSGVETFEHLFFQCPINRPIFDAIVLHCDRLHKRQPRWKDLLFGHRVVLADDVPEHGSRLLWHIVCCVYMNTVWRLRNDKKHRGQEPAPTAAVVATITSLVRAHCLSASRRADETEL